MTNLEYIRSLPLEELAKMLVKHECENDPDEDFDGNLVDWYQNWYYAPDGRASMWEEDAVEFTLEWLEQEHSDDQE